MDGSSAWQLLHGGSIGRGVRFPRKRGLQKVGYILPGGFHEIDFNPRRINQDAGDLCYSARTIDFHWIFTVAQIFKGVE